MRRAQSFEVGGHDHEPALHVVVHQRLLHPQEQMLGPGRSVEGGAQAGPIPVVPCAHVVSGQPAAGGCPAGIAMVPETAMSRPSMLFE